MLFLEGWECLNNKFHEIIAKISFSVVWKLNSNFFAWLENNLFVREWVHLALNFRAKLQVLNKVSNKELSVCTKDAKMGREQKQMVLQEILFNCTPGLWFYFYVYTILSTSIYDLVLVYVCHFHHHFLLHLIVSQIWPLSRYSCCYLGSLHPRNFFQKLCPSDP